MPQFKGSAQAAVDYNSTIIGAMELSEKKWVLAVQLPGVDRHSRHVLDACGGRRNDVGTPGPSSLTSTSITPSSNPRIESAMRVLGVPASIHGNFQGSAQVFAQSLAARKTRFASVRRVTSFRCKAERSEGLARSAKSSERSPS